MNRISTKEVLTSVSRHIPVLLLLIVTLTGCAAKNEATPENAKSLMAIAKVFNDDYGRNIDFLMPHTLPNSVVRAADRMRLCVTSRI